MGVLASCGLTSLREESPKTAETFSNTPPELGASNIGLRKRILVLPFIDEKISRSQNVVDAARAAVVNKLSQTQQFVVLKNSDMPKDVSAFMTENREYDLEKLAPIANSLGVAAIIEGKILEIKAKRVGDEVGLFRDVKARVETKVRIRVMSSKSGRLLLEEVRDGVVESTTTRVVESTQSDRYLSEDPKLIHLSVRQAFQGSLVNITKSIDKISWEGLIAMVSGERVFINAGRISGIQVGDILKVSEEGDEIFDPDTGVFIGKAPGRMKGTVEVVSYFGKDGAICVIHSGSGFKENDKVELY
jgi:hypothetical protein